MLRLLERRQVGAHGILDQHPRHQRAVVRIEQHGANGQAADAGRADPAMTEHDLVAILAVPRRQAAQADGVELSLLAHRLAQPEERFVGEGRLAAVAPDAVDDPAGIDLGHHPAGGDRFLHLGLEPCIGIGGMLADPGHLGADRHQRRPPGGARAGARGGALLAQAQDGGVEIVGGAVGGGHGRGPPSRGHQAAARLRRRGSRAERSRPAGTLPHCAWINPSISRFTASMKARPRAWARRSGAGSTSYRVRFRLPA